MDGVALAVPRRRTDVALWLLGLFTAWMWLQNFWAVSAARHLDGCILFTKYTVLVFLLTRMIESEVALELFGWAHVCGCFWWGFVAYMTYGGGRVELNLGPGVADANTIGLHLVTGLSFAGFLLVALPQRRRFLALVAIPFILNGVILTASRGAVLAMAGAGMGALFFAPRMRRGTLYVAALLGVVLFFRLAGSQLFWDRMDTLSVEQSQPMEASAASRFDIASANWRMAEDYPFGAGYRGNAFLSPRYLAEQFLSEGERSAHNTYLAVLVDEGIPGLILFVSLMLWSLFRLARMRRLDKIGLPVVFGTFRGAVGASLIGYLIAGMFSNYMSAEVGIWLVALVSILNRFSRDYVTAAQQQPAAPPTLSSYPFALASGQ